MAYLESKGEGDKSMPLKRGACRGVLGAASRDPCDKAKAGLLEAQSPVMKVRIHRKRRLKPMPHRVPVRTGPWGNLRGVEHRPICRIQGYAEFAGSGRVSRLLREAVHGGLLGIILLVD